MKKFFFPVLCLSIALTACNTGGQQSSSTGTMSVSASFYPLAFFTEQIGENLVTVHQITPGGVEPHDYDPSPQEIAAIYDSKVFIMNGAGVDAWGDKIIDDLKQKGVVTVRMEDTMSLLGGFNEQGESDPLHPSSQDTNILDPHIWLDPVNAEGEVSRIRDALVTADPAHTDTYNSNAAALEAKLSALDTAYKNGLAHCTLHDAVVSHNAFRYMAQRYGFTTLAIAGLDPEQEPTPQRIAELADFAKKNNIKYIFFEALVSPKVSQTVADEIGAQSLVLDPLEGLTPDEEKNGDTYLTIMQQNLQNLRTALQCQ